MKKLNELFLTEHDVEINDIKTNSKEINKGDLFVCIKGFNVDRHDFIKEAEELGAAALVVSKDVDSKLPTIKVNNTNDELINIVTKFYDYPSTKMSMIGITGTDGKTSISTIIYQLINRIKKTGYIGTNGVECPGYKVLSNNTTPTPEHIHRHLYNFYNCGCEAVVMEAASEGLSQGRCENIEFDYSIFTNLTHEHLNFHKTMDNYLDAKGILFKQTKKTGYSIINIDDEYGKKIAEKSNGKVLFYGKDDHADFKFSDVIITRNFTSFKLSYKDTSYDISIPLLGLFNVYNMTAALALIILMGYDINMLKPYFKDLYIEGRMNSIDLGQDFKVFVDFAHTPNGCLKLLEFVNTLGFKRIIAVSGSAGERDALKRPIMGEILVNNSDYVIFTYDDPRTEDPNEIINQMVSTVLDKNYKFERIIDRKIAIKRAIEIASTNDIVLIIGRGNETMVPIGKEKIYMSDIEETEKALKERLKQSIVQ